MNPSRLLFCETWRTTIALGPWWRWMQTHSQSNREGRSIHPRARNQSPRTTKSKRSSSERAMQMPLFSFPAALVSSVDMGPCSACNSLLMQLLLACSAFCRHDCRDRRGVHGLQGRVRERTASSTSCRPRWAQHGERDKLLGSPATFPVLTNSPSIPPNAASQPRDSGLSLALQTMRVGELATIYIEDPK
jgi:hypothetical protein